MAQYEWTVGWHNAETFKFQASIGPKKLGGEFCSHPAGRQEWRSVTAEVTITDVVSDRQGPIPGVFVGRGRVAAQAQFWDMDVPDEEKAIAQMALSSLLGNAIPCVAGVYAA